MYIININNIYYVILYIININTNINNLETKYVKYI
jgi:hypothetical protein